MSYYQRIHHSLAGKTFRVLILFYLILNATALIFGNYLYYSSVRRDYRNRTWQMSRTANHFMDTEAALDEAAKVMTIYYGMSDEERDQLNDKHSPLLSAFDEVRDEKFEELRFTLLDIQETNGGIAAFTAFLDPETNRRVFIADSDPNDSFCPPGSWDELKAESIRDLTEGRSYFLDNLFGAGKIPVTTINMEPYGYRCMGGTIIGMIDGNPVFVFFDTDMNAAMSTVKKFMWAYIVMMAGISIAALYAALRNLNRRTVRPINQLAAAAKAYSQDRSSDTPSGNHFEKLNIRTGDEIENLSLTMQEMERDLDAYMKNLTRITAERERISTELSLATRIQADMLPNIFPAFPERPEFDIYAVMDPAKEVGGDFYDFFLIDDDHLCLVIADVSGKGVPAALFMMISKILVQNVAMTGLNPAGILEIVNHQICANNREEMFVTIWLGILGISTGILTAANAGHEYPVIMEPEGSFSVHKDKHSFVIGGMDGMLYHNYTIPLQPGARLFVHTDGVTEATDAGHNLFGTERMLEALNQNKDGSAKEVIQGVLEAVESFVAGAEQFDDITMLCIEYTGPKENA